MVQCMATALQRHNYFPTLIYFADLPGAASFNAAIKPLVYAWRSADPVGLPNMTQDGCWRSRDDLQHNPSCEWLASAVIAAAQNVFDGLGYDSAYAAVFDNMWANINPRHGYNRSHTHPNSLWSGVYYVQTPADCGRILFSDPRSQASVILPQYAPGEPGPEAWGAVCFDPVAGRLILFPSWLRHEVEPNLAQAESPEGDRIAISFNIRQGRRIPTKAGPRAVDL